MDADPEAQALLATFKGMTATTVLDDPLDGAAKGELAGPLSFAERQGADRALAFPPDRVDAVHVRYGAWIARRGRFALDFRASAEPAQRSFYTLLSVGTAGNTNVTVRLGLDHRVTATVLNKREYVTVVSDPVDPAAWHHLELWYGPEGIVLCLDGAIEDYATDYGAPYAVELSNALYLGDQPWWDADGRKGVFYPDDSFVGLLDHLHIDRLLPKEAP